MSPPVGSAFIPADVVRKRRETGDERWKAPADMADRSFLEALQKSVKTPFSKLHSPSLVLYNLADNQSF